MERIWLKSYPEGVPADINPTAYASLGDFFAASVDRYRDRVAYVSMKQDDDLRRARPASRALSPPISRKSSASSAARASR